VPASGRAARPARTSLRRRARAAGPSRGAGPAVLRARRSVDQGHGGALQPPDRVPRPARREHPRAERRGDQPRAVDSAPLLDAVADADIDLTSATSEADLKATILARLGRYRLAGAHQLVLSSRWPPPGRSAWILVGLPGAGKTTFFHARYPRTSTSARTRGPTRATSRRGRMPRCVSRLPPDDRSSSKHQRVGRRAGARDRDRAGARRADRRLLRRGRDPEAVRETAAHGPRKVRKVAIFTAGQALAAPRLDEGFDELTRPAAEGGGFADCPRLTFYPEDPHTRVECLRKRADREHSAHLQARSTCSSPDPDLGPPHGRASPAPSRASPTTC